MKEEKKLLPLSITGDFQTFKHTAIPCLDWLQFNFKGTFTKSPFFDCAKLDYSTRTFKNIYEISNGKWRKATIVNEPLSMIIPPETNLIKSDNRELYWQYPVKRLLRIGNEHQLNFHCASRIDLAIDFNTFCNNRQPAQFITDFMQNKFIKKGHNSFQCMGKQNNNFLFHYLKFSKTNSNIQAYLYNKSKELREVKKKNYIIEHWEKNGLDVTSDVWRLEFAIHNPKFNITDKTTGDVQQFNPILLDNEDYLRVVTNILINKYWDFRYNDNQKVINRMKKVKLFNNITDRYIISYSSETPDTTKADRQFLNKLKDLNNECRALANSEAYSTNIIVNYFKKTRKL
jgi:hypothetical protein